MLLSRLATEGESLVPLTEIQDSARQEFIRTCREGGFDLSPLPCACGGARDSVVAGRDRYGFPLTTKLCMNCGLLRSDPYYSDESLARFYRAHYRRLYSGRTKCDEEFFQAQLAQGRNILAYVQGIVPTGKVLEIGCGAGGILKAFRDAGWDASGCDYDEEFLAFGRRKGLRLFLGGARNLAADGKADLIIFSHVLEHVRNPLGAILEAKALLKQPGALYVELPGVLSIGEQYGDFAFFLQNAHCWHFCRATLVGFLRRAGFSCLKADERVRGVFRAESGQENEIPDPHLPTKIIRLLVAQEVKRWFSIRTYQNRFGRFFLVRMLLGNRLYVAGSRIWRDARKRWL